MANDVPLPVWNSTTGSWEPVDMRDGQRVTRWPDGFDPGILPLPEYQEGEHVQFVRDETCAREGRVRRVLLAPRPGSRPAEGQRSWLVNRLKVRTKKSVESLCVEASAQKRWAEASTRFPVLGF